MSTALPPPRLGLAYRDWLLTLARSEADNGCVRLFGMKSDIAMYFADIARNWTPDRCYQLMCAGTKLLCERNYGWPPIALTDDEQQAWKSFDYPYKARWRSPEKPGAEITWATSGRRATIDADKVGAAHRWERAMLGKYLIDKKRLKNIIREVMRPIFGAPDEGIGAIWQYTIRLNDMKITTSVDFGGRRPSQVRYGHYVVQTKDQHSVEILRSGGISALLGWPQTEWSYITEADMPAAAELLARLCREFAEAVPWMAERSSSET